MTMPAVETIPEPAELSLTDRCDACGAAAKNRAVKLYTGPAKAASDLLFCGHHATEHGTALIAKGWIIR